MTARPVLAVLLGTRPEAIKLAPVILEYRRRSLPIALIGTGQHKELVDQVLDLFGLELDEDLGLMRPGQTLDHIVAGAVQGVGELLDVYQPARVMVQGDTSSTLAAALAAFHRHIPVAHVEAGLRSGDLELPFPEEMNRRATSIIARWHFAPTRQAVLNLEREGVGDGVFEVGNTIVDAVEAILDTQPVVPPEIAEFISGEPYILATAHRRESWHGGIENVSLALRAVLDELVDHRLVFVTHPNPIARAPVMAILGQHPRAHVVGALPYGSFLALLRTASVVVSDSGGIQEEAPTLGIPALVTRIRTERVEGVEASAVRLVGTDPERLRDETLRILRDPGVRDAMANAGRRLYGDGRAAQRIVDILESPRSDG